MAHDEGTADELTYVEGEEGELSVPIVGIDGSTIPFWLNLSTVNGMKLASRNFSFKLDIDPPSVPMDLAIRADGPTDQRIGNDDDTEVFLTWSDVIETGSGFKSVCYSIDENLHPQEENPTTESGEPFLIINGAHTVYVWALDNAGRASPSVELPLNIDESWPEFGNIVPDTFINVTDQSYTISADLWDDLSGVDMDTIEFRRSTPEGRLGNDWSSQDADGDPLGTVRITREVELHPGINNVFQFRAMDRAGNGPEQSPVMTIYYDPDLSVPSIDLTGPADGMVISKVGGIVEFGWEGTYIRPDNLTYAVDIVLPDASTQKLDAGSSGTIEYAPKIPGEYLWSVIGSDGSVSNRSSERMFVFDPPKPGVSGIGNIEVPSGGEKQLTAKVTNPLEVETTVTVSLEDGGNLTLGGATSAVVSALSSESLELSINGSGVSPGEYPVTLSFTDGFERISSVQITVTVLEEGDHQNGDEPSDDEFPLLIVLVAGIVILLVIGLVAFFFFRKSGAEADEFEEVEEEPDVYDPTGKYVMDGDKVESAVPMTPAMVGGEEARRILGSNVMEFEMPKKDKEEPDTSIVDRVPVVAPQPGMDTPSSGDDSAIEEE